MSSSRWDDDKRAKSEWQRIANEDPADHWKRRLREARLGDTRAETVALSDIPIGTNTTTNQPVVISPETLRTHMHVVGATGVGKSFFLEGIIKRLIEQGHGLCLITPHEDIYERILDYCARVHVAKPELGLARRVIPFDISNTRQILGFNPVARNARVMSYQVVALMDSIRKCWGQVNFQQTPRLARWLFNTGYAIVESNLTLLQARHLVDTKPNPYRHAIAGRIRNPEIRAEWEWIMAQKMPVQDDRLESSFKRLREFVGHELIRLIFGQHTKTLNFPSVMQEGKILLVNLARRGTMGEDNQHLIGTLLVNELLTAAFARRQGERNPFFLCIDEFQHFATKDICEILDGGRKFGLHLILAHQLLNQLKAKEPEVYYSTLTNARTKVVFGGLMDEDLDVFSRELFTGELDPDQIKDEIWHTAYKPVETTRLIVSESESSGGGDSNISHEALSQVFIPESGFLSGESDRVAVSSGGAAGHNDFWQRGSTSTQVPWYEYHESTELTSRSFRTLEEQLYIKKAQLKRQPQQHAAILRPDHHVEFVKTPTLNEFPDSLRGEFLQECFESAGCFKSPEQAEREVSELEESLFARETIVINTVPDDCDDVPLE
jgi:hypothetical protein